MIIDLVRSGPDPLKREVFFIFSQLLALQLFTQLEIYPGLEASPKLSQIKVEGHKKSHPDYIIHFSGLKIGQELTSRDVDEALKKIRRFGQFDEVNIRIENVGGDRQQKKLTIVVKEKISWFVVPYFSMSEGKFSFGSALGETNLFGVMKTVAVLGDWGPEQRRVAASYRDSAIMRSPFVLQIDGIMRREDLIEYRDELEIRELRLTESGATVMPGYRLRDDLSFSIGSFLRQVRQRVLREEANLRVIDSRKGLDSALIARMEFDQRNNTEGFMTGALVRLETNWSDERFGSNYEYMLQKLYFNAGYDVFKKYLNIQHDLNIQFGRDLPFYREVTAGGDNLRGYISSQFRGDTRYSLKTELWFPIFRIKWFVLRGVAFWDTTLIYFRQEDFNRDNWKNGLGGGLRTYIRGISIPVIGFDVAQGLEDGNLRTYLNIGAKF